MKSIKYLNIAASVLMLAACAKEELVPSEELIPVSESTTVTFVASDGTKTVLGGDLKTTSWDKKENVLLWEGETPLIISDDDKSYSEDGKKLTITKEVASLESTFYSIIGPEGEGNVTKISAAVLATQNPKPTSFDPNAEILVAQPATCGEGNTVALRYNRPVAITVATLKNLEEGEKVLSVKITADKKLTGNVNFKYEGTNVIAEMAGTGDAITCNYTTNNTVVQGNEGEGYIFPVYFISLKAEVMVFEFEVCTDKHKYYRKITRPEDSPIVLNDNRVATFGFKLENADKADAEGDKFVKVTEEPDDWSGEYLLVYEASNNKALCWTGVDEASCYVETDVANGEIAAKPDGAVTLTIASIDNGYSIKVNGGDNNGKYIYGSSGSNTINFGTTATLNTLLYNSGVSITSNTSVMRYNSASNNNRFRYFKSSSYSDQQPVQLYKKAAGGYGKYTLATPANIQYSAETQEITWDAVENAGKYTISLNGGESVECPSNEYDASTLAAEYYYATVVAYPSAEKEDTYKESEAGTNEGWLRIGEPKMLKLDADKITLNITSTSITASWENDVNATNGYIAEIWSRKTVESGETDDQGNPKTRLEDDELISKNENVTEGAITFTYLNAGTDYHIKVTTKATDIIDVRGTRAYANSDAANKYPKTSSVYTIAQIFDLESSTVACEVEKAVIYAKGESCYLVYDGTGYIMVNTSAGNYSVGDELTISGKTEKSNNQKRFDSTTTIVEKTGTSTVSHPTENTYDGEFTYAKYVKIIGKTSISGGVVSIADADGHSLKLIDNAGLEGDQYVSVTGYLTHKTPAGHINMIVVGKQINTITITENDGHEWDSNSTTEKSFTISTDNNAGWTYESDNTTDWTVKSDNNKLKVYPNAINTSTTSGKSLTITLTHSGNTMLTTSIQCSQKPKPVVYEKYTDNLTEGYYLITYGNDAMKNSVASNRLEYVTITPQSDKVTDPAVSIVWKIAKSGNYWTIYNESVQKYAASTGAKNAAALNSSIDDKSLWTVTMNNGTFEFVNKQNSTNGVNAYLRKNGTYGFACYAKGTGGDLTLYKLEDQRTPSDLAWSVNTKELGLDDEVADMPTLSGHNASAATYSSSKTSVATVDASGNVKIVGVGETVIKATVEADDTYRAGEATYTLTVTAPERNFSATPVSFTGVAAAGASGQTVTITASPKVVWSLLEDDGITVTSCTATKEGDNYKGSGVITFSVSENTGLERELLLIVSTSDTYVETKEYDVVISQNGAVIAKSFDVTESSSVNDVVKDGSTEIIHITGDSDVAWTASLTSGDANAISFTRSGTGPKDNSVVINANSGAARSFVITVSTTNELVPEASRTHVITYNQAAGVVDKTYTLTFPDDNSANNKVGAYDKEWTAKCDNFSWTIKNFNNNNWSGSWTYIKCGSKKGASTGTITAQIPEAIKRVKLTIDNTGSNVSTVKLIVASDSGFTSVKEEHSFTNSAGEQTVSIDSPNANYHYKIEVVCTKASSNGPFQTSKVVYTTTTTD